MPRILIVDDEPPIRNLLSLVFSLDGYEVRTAADGVEALALCETESFDAVLSDVVMPEMNGHDLAQQVAQRHPETHTVLMSGFDTGCEECPLSPRCKRLAKPFRPSEAVSLIRGLLDKGAPS